MTQTRACALARQIAHALDALDEEDRLISERLRACPDLDTDSILLDAGPVEIKRAEGLPGGLSEAISEWAISNEREARAWLGSSSA